VAPASGQRSSLLDARHDRDRLADALALVRDDGRDLLVGAEPARGLPTTSI
jgi:hypothetical protein